MGKDKSDRAKKGAQTRALNAQIEQEEAQRLIEETKGGRSAKKDALSNAIWKRNVDKRAVSPLAGERKVSKDIGKMMR